MSSKIEKPNDSILVSKRETKGDFHGKTTKMCGPQVLDVWPVPKCYLHLLHFLRRTCQPMRSSSVTKIMNSSCCFSGAWVKSVGYHNLLSSFMAFAKWNWSRLIICEASWWPGSFENIDQPWLNIYNIPLPIQHWRRIARSQMRCWTKKWLIMVFNSY